MINPYIIDRPLTDHDWFVGREPSFRTLEKALSDGEHMMLLCGRRFTGKTSFINQLPNYLKDGYKLVYVNWDPASVSEDPYWELLAAISEITGKPLIDQQSYAKDPYEYGKVFLRLVCGQGSRNLTLFCLDSLEASALSRGSKWEAVLGTLLDIQASLPSAAFLIVAEGHPGEVTSPAALALPPISLRPLDDQEVEDLVGVPARSAVVFDYELIRQVGGLAGGEPYLVQILAKLLFENRGTNSWLGPNAIDTVNEGALEQASPYFVSLWEEANPQAQVMLAAFAAMTGHHGVGSVEDVALYFKRQHIQVPKADIEKMIAYLADRDYMQKLGGGVLQFKSELFRVWLKRNYPLPDVLADHKLYRHTRTPKPAAWKGKKVDWVGVLLWTMAVGMVAAIIVLWQSRNTNLFRMTHFNVSEQTAVPTAASITDTARTTFIVYQGRASAQGKWSIYLMRSDGTEIKQLTDGSSNDINPVLSPDGRQVVFVSDRDGNREIYKMNVDGSGVTNLTRNVAEDWTPAWSPDGRYIAFSSFRDNNWELYVMNADGANQTRLTENSAADYAPSWSPDGKSLAFVSDRDGNLEIYIKNLNETVDRRFTDNPATDTTPAWAPVGNKIAWASYRDGNMEIYTAGLDGANPVNITQDPISDDQGPSWSADGQRIAFYSNRDHGWDIYTLEIETGKTVNLTYSQAVEQSPSWGKQ